MNGGATIEYRDLRRDPVDQGQREIGDHRIEEERRRHADRDAERLAEHEADVPQRIGGVEIAPKRDRVVGRDQAPNDFPMKIGDEDQRRGGHRDHGGERRHDLVDVDLDAERIDERPTDSPPRPPSDSSAEKNSRPARRSSRRSGPPSRSSATSRSDRRRAIAVALGPSSNGASDSVIATATNRRICIGICEFDTPGASIRHAPIRQNSTNVARMTFGFRPGSASVHHERRHSVRPRRRAI